MRFIPFGLRRVVKVGPKMRGILVKKWSYKFVSRLLACPCTISQQLFYKTLIEVKGGRHPRLTPTPTLLAPINLPFFTFISSPLFNYVWEYSEETPIKCGNALQRTFYMYLKIIFDLPPPPGP